MPYDITGVPDLYDTFTSDFVNSFKTIMTTSASFGSGSPAEKQEAKNISAESSKLVKFPSVIYVSHCEANVH